MGTLVVTVNEVLDGHVALDIQCLDRIYLNAYRRSATLGMDSHSSCGRPVLPGWLVQGHTV